jgi:predicted nicotinamide N-methyase
VPGVPEIRLHRAGPSSGLMRLAQADPDFGSPYWTRPWGGGLALARHVLDRPEVVAGKRVLDLGAGSGEVKAADVDPYAVVAMRLNAAANGVMVEAWLGDLTTDEPSEVDLMLVGDLFYDPDLAARVLAYLERCVAAGIEVLIGDPWRASLPTDRLAVVAEYPVADYGDVEGTKRSAAVFRLIG